ncbi:Hypothetical predicted protein, partial [Olea europaea subsp. europaea]
DIVPLEDAALGDRTLRGCKDIFRIEDEALENRNFEKIEEIAGSGRLGLLLLEDQALGDCIFGKTEVERRIPLEDEAL